MTDSTDRTAVLADLAGMLAAVTRQSPRWAAAITAESRLEGDLRLDSLEAAELGELMRARYGVSLLSLLTTLEIDRLIALTVGDVAAYVEEHAIT